ncbi:MAG: PEP-CTERM sorting domain-containing protein, partial [Planctomycetota bacterium]
AGKSYGIWVSHLVVAGNNKLIGIDFSFAAFASIKDVSGSVSQASSSFAAIPAPGAIALVGLAGLAAGRRRRA